MDNSNQLSSWIGDAILIWTGSRIKLQKGISITTISEYEKQLDFKFPNDFVDLYQKVNGFEDFDWNKNMFSLWSLDRILKEYQEDNDKDYIGFCDYLINSHSIGFIKSDSRIFKLNGSCPPIANTFQEAISLLNSNSDLLY